MKPARRGINDAQWLLDGGLTLNLAPVVDVAVNPGQPDHRRSRGALFG